MELRRGPERARSAAYHAYRLRARVPPGVAISRRSAFPERNGELCGPALRWYEVLAQPGPVLWLTEAV